MDDHGRFRGPLAVVHDGRTLELPASSTNALHKTYGVYLNGSWKRNAVADEHLQDHIKYNLDYRPGRALIVDGVVVHRGCFKEEEIEAFVRDTLPDIDRGWAPTRASVPYH